MKLTKGVFLMLGLHWALAQGPTPPKPCEWGERTGSFQLSISSDKEQYETGETIRVTARLKNVTDQPAGIAMATPFMLYTIDIRVPMPEWIPWKPQAVLTPFGRDQKNPLSQNVHGWLLLPGREEIHEFDLDKLYEMSAPGVYKVTFSCEHPRKKSAEPGRTVISNTIKVTVLGKKD